MHKVTKARRQESKQTRPALIQTRPAVTLQVAEDLLPEAPHAWFGVQGLGFRVWGSGFVVQGLGFRVQGLDVLPEAPRDSGCAFRR